MTVPNFPRRLCLFFLLLILCGLSRPTWALDIQHVRVGVYPDKTRIVLDLSGAADFRAFILPEPWRLAVDLPAFTWQAGNPPLPARSGLSTMRQGQLTEGVSRLIFELSKPGAIKTAFILPAQGALPTRLVVDLASVTDQEAAANREHVFGKLQATPPAAPVKDKQSRNHKDDGTFPVLPARKTPVTPYREGSAGKPLVIVDPGHGGVDPGTHGPGAMVEKDVTLAAAQNLKETLESSGRYRVLLTRNDDTYVGLYDRVKFAREHKGDLFISLHADSSPVASTVGGASIYTLSDKASDAETAKLAQRENDADQIAGVKLRDQDADVANILVDLAMRDTMNQSKFFASMVTGNFRSVAIPTLEHTNRAAGFAVLKDPDMPSILVEMGFLSNPREAMALNQPEFRARLAQALTASVDTYFSRLAEK